MLGLRVARPDLLALTALAWAVTLLLAGAAAAMTVRSHSELGAVDDLGALLLSTLARAMVPLSLLPRGRRPVAPASPGYWALRGAGWRGDGDVAAVLRSVGVLALVSLALGCARRMSRG